MDNLAFAVQKFCSITMLIDCEYYSEEEKGEDKSSASAEVVEHLSSFEKAEE